MDLYQGLLLITSIHLLAAAAPGPDFVLVTQQTLSNGKRAGLLCSLGIAAGLSIHIFYSSLGLAVLIANSSSALWGIKILGGVYLIYLGVSGLRVKARKAKAVTVQTASKRSPLKNCWSWIFVQCAQPQSTHLFCVTIYNRFISGYFCSAFAGLRFMDDGITARLVLTAHCAVIKTHSNYQISTHGALDRPYCRRHYATVRH